MIIKLNKSSMNQCEFKIMLILGLLDVATETRTCDCSNVTCELVTLEHNYEHNYEHNS